MANGSPKSPCLYCQTMSHYQCDSAEEAKGCAIKNGVGMQGPRSTFEASPTSPKMIYGNSQREKLLNEAMEITHKDRNAQYGSPEDNFKQIAALWNAYYFARLSNRPTRAAPFEFEPADVAVMNMLIKVARLSKTPTHHDSAVDIAGYAACLAEIQESLRNRSDGSASA